MNASLLGKEQKIQLRAKNSEILSKILSLLNHNVTATKKIERHSVQFIHPKQKENLISTLKLNKNKQTGNNTLFQI